MLLRALEYPKINLCVCRDHDAANTFYDSLGYEKESVINATNG